MLKKMKEQHKHLAIFPAKLRVLPQYIFNTRDPIVIGVRIDDGTLRCGTPVTALCKEVTSLYLRNTIYIHVM